MRGFFLVIHSLCSWINSPRSSDLAVAQLGGDQKSTLQRCGVFLVSRGVDRCNIDQRSFEVASEPAVRLDRAVVTCRSLRPRRSLHVGPNSRVRRFERGLRQKVPLLLLRNNTGVAHDKSCARNYQGLTSRLMEYSDSHGGRFEPSFKACHAHSVSVELRAAQATQPIVQR